MLLTGKNVLITGTNRGIGAALLRAFASHGACVIAHARSRSDELEERILALRNEFGVAIDPVYFDVTDYGAVKAFIRDLVGRKVAIHGLVNNAGVTCNMLFHMTREEELRRQLEVNFFSVYLLSQQISRLMVRQQTGSIVNIASTAAMDGNPGKSAYGASKAAVVAMTRSVAAELGAQKIRVNAIAPGITETDMLDSMPADVVAAARNAADLRRGGLPREIADTAVFLVSDLSSYITGQVIRVDGGLK